MSEFVAALVAEYIEDAAEAYVQAALWASTDADGEPLDKVYDTDDIADESRRRMRARCGTCTHRPLAPRRGVTA